MAATYQRAVLVLLYVAAGCATGSPESDLGTGTQFNEPTDAAVPNEARSYVDAMTDGRSLGTGKVEASLFDSEVETSTTLDAITPPDVATEAFVDASPDTLDAADSAWPIDASPPTPDAADGCTLGSLGDVFLFGMIGCSGSVIWDKRDSLCAAGFHVCSAIEWIANRGPSAPTHNYWTSDDLKYVGSSNSCYVSRREGTACDTGRPMRVCAGYSDSEGNTCTWISCGYDDPAPPQYFGGCSADPTAGALCCTN